MDNNETPDAIVKEIRSLVQEARKYPRDVEITTADAEDWADRIEAAAEREREMSKDLSKKLDKNHAIPGNAVALREALEHIEKLTREFNVGNYSRPDYTQWVLDSVRFALAAPARNCDRFATAYEALKAWEGGLDTAGDIVRMVTWLLGKAEGGAE